MAPPTVTLTRRPARQSIVSSGVPNHHLDFLARFTEQEVQNRIAKRPQPLTVREHRANREALKQVRFINRRYADETKINVAVIYRKWRAYCEEHGMGEWREALERLTREILLDFFLHVSEVSRIKSWGTSHEYIRQFQILYRNVSGQYLDRNDSNELYKYHETYLIPRFGYRAPNLDGKPVVSVAGLRVMLVFNIAYDTGIFPLEIHRLYLDDCYLLLCCTGCRPAELVNNERKEPKDGSVKEIFDRKALPGGACGEEGGDTGEENDDEYEMTLDEKSRALHRLLVQETVGRGRPKALCYEDILLMIVRHPATGAHVPAMAIKFIHHKGADKKPRPTIFFFTLTKKLIFCAISRIMALALYDGAFDAESLTCASRLLETKVWGRCECIPLRWKQSKLKIPVFRKCSRAVLSDDEAMSYAKLRDDMRRQSLEAGFEQHWTPRFARRGAANAANGNAPDAVRDQMLRHDPRFATFYGAYINEIAQFHLQNAFLEEETEDLLFKMFAHVSLTRDPRATRDMVPQEVWANLPPDPEIVALEKRRALLKQGRSRIQGLDAEAEIRQLTAKIRTKTVQREKSIVKEYREYYFYNRPTWDIERQARGEEEEEEDYADPEVKLAIPERARLAQIWCNQPQNWSEEELVRHRVEAIDLMVALCDKRETVRRDRIRARPEIEPAIKQESSEPEPFPLLLNPNQCPDCIGDARLSHQERAFQFCRPTVRNDHFDDQHLEQREQALQRGDPIRCEHPACKAEKFRHLDHFRAHVQLVHKVTLRSAAQVETRRRKKVMHRQMTRTAKLQA